MSKPQSELLAELRADFEGLLNLVSGAEAQTATVNQLERSLLRQLLAMGRKLLQVFLIHRAEAESHAPQYGWQRQKFVYHSQKAVDYLSVFGKLEVNRAYFYAPGVGGKTPLDCALSLPERCYSDLLMECAVLLAVDGAYDKASQVVARLLGVDVSVLASSATRILRQAGLSVTLTSSAGARLAMCSWKIGVACICSCKVITPAV